MTTTKPSLELLLMMQGVDHLEASVDYYRELGLSPVWWPDEDSVVLSACRGRPASLLLTSDPAETMLGPGGLYVVDRLDDFFQRHPRLDWLVKPSDRPFGRYAVLADRTGIPVRLVECTRDPAVLAAIGRVLS